MSKFVPEASHGCLRTFKGREHLTSYWLVRYRGKQWLEHRLVMSLHLGRELERHELVHHRDGNGLNNSIDNLLLTDPHAHNAMHDKVRWDWKEAIKLRQQGWTIQQLADHFGVNYSAIRKVLLSRGASSKDLRHGKHYWPVELAISRYLAGESCHSIGLSLGFPAMSLKKALVKRGLYVPYRNR